MDQLRLTITLSARGRTRTLPLHTRGLGCHPSKLICRDRNPRLTITRRPTLCHLLRVCGPVMVHPVVACIAPSIWNTTCFPILSVRCSQSWLAKVMPLGLDWSAYKPVVDTIGYCYFSFLFFYSLFFLLFRIIRYFRWCLIVSLTVCASMIPISCSISLFCDNLSFILNTTKRLRLCAFLHRPTKVPLSDFWQYSWSENQEKKKKKLFH